MMVFFRVCGVVIEWTSRNQKHGGNWTSKNWKSKRERQKEKETDRQTDRQIEARMGRAHNIPI